MARRVLLGVLVLLAFAPVPARADGRPPNVVLIIGDDHGYPDYGFMGSPILHTPRLDALATEGALLRTGYSTASHCSPALRTLLTGLYPIQFEAIVAIDEARRDPVLAFDRQIGLFETLPAALAAAGYDTFMAGKSWEADYAMAGFADGVDNPPPTKEERMPVPVGRTTMDPVFAFVDAHAKRGAALDVVGEEEGRPDSPPFFLWFAPKLPHSPHDAHFRYRRRYGRSGFSYAAIAYYANIERYDHVVGQLLDRLDAAGLRDDTVVIQLADNGWDQGPHATPDAKPPLDWDGPHGKRTMYDLGFRTPILVRWPGRIAAGSETDAVVSIIDVVATIRDVAGLPPRDDLPGRSLRPALEGETPWGDRRRAIGSMTHPRDNGLRPASLGNRRADRPETAYFVRTNEWHYIWYPSWNDAEELYDVRADPDERNDLSSSRAGVAQRLRGEIVAWRRAMEASPPVEAARAASSKAPGAGATPP